MTKNDVGHMMYQWAKDLWPICRSITGQGLRDTLEYIQSELPSLEICEIPSGTQVFDWEIPDEWNIRDAFIADSSGRRVVDFRENNLHVVGYSAPVDKWMCLDDLQDHLYSIPNMPDAVPYVTSYYQRRWGFCVTHNQRAKMTAGKYHAYIDADISAGVLNFGHLIIPGDSEKEVFLSTYVCHPSMANNELSGPVVAMALARWIYALPHRRYTYRIAFVPETIGALAYLSRYLERMKRNVVAGFVLTCLGDERSYSFLPSRAGDTLADRVAIHVLESIAPDYLRFTWLERGSDERQYCAPGIDLPVASVMRTKYGTYPEYHTSKDDLSLVTPHGLQGGYEALRAVIRALERNAILETTVLGEPFLSKWGLYPTLSGPEKHLHARDALNIVSLADGTRDLIQISREIGRYILDIAPMVRELVDAGILKASDP